MDVGGSDGTMDAVWSVDSARGSLASAVERPDGELDKWIGKWRDEWILEVRED